MDDPAGFVPLFFQLLAVIAFKLIRKAYVILVRIKSSKHTVILVVWLSVAYPFLRFWYG